MTKFQKRLALGLLSVAAATMLVGLRWSWGNRWQHITVSPPVTHAT